MFPTLTLWFQVRGPDVPEGVRGPPDRTARLQALLPAVRLGAAAGQRGAPDEGEAHRVPAPAQGRFGRGPDRAAEPAPTDQLQGGYFMLFLRFMCEIYVAVVTK